MWLGVHIIMLFALLFKDFMRVSWEEMNEIDQAEDEEAEFVFAEKENVEGNAESEAARSEWEYYKKMGVMQRAEAYARKNNIKRTGTFHMKVCAMKYTLHFVECVNLELFSECSGNRIYQF